MTGAELAGPDVEELGVALTIGLGVTVTFVTGGGVAGYVGSGLAANADPASPSVPMTMVPRPVTAAVRAAVAVRKVTFTLFPPKLM
jgi:hypothetical protein